jgi:hypothetical protein
LNYLFPLLDSDLSVEIKLDINMNELPTTDSMPIPLLITRDDVNELPRGGVSILYSLATRAGDAEVVVRVGRLPERRLTALLTLPLLAFGTVIAALVASSPNEEAFGLGIALGVGVGVGGAVSVWGFFAFVTLLQSLRSRLLVIDRLTGRITSPRADLYFESSEGLALLAYSHLEKGRRHGFNFGSNRAVQRDTWVTEVGLITSKETLGSDAERYTPLWQRRVGRWLTWVAPNSTPEGVARQLRYLHEATGLPVLAVQAKNPKPLLIEGVAWDPIRKRTF